MHGVMKEHTCSTRPPARNGSWPDPHALPRPARARTFLRPDRRKTRPGPGALLRAVPAHDTIIGGSDTRHAPKRNGVRVRMMAREVQYTRSRFSTRLLDNRLYTAGHSWLEREEGDLWRIGFTKFAVRMLGDIVELGFETTPGSTVETGQVIGWLEGFKAVTDIFSPLSGRFEGSNPALDEKITLLSTAPYTRGWLFKVQGHPDTDCLDVQGYVSLLDTTIDKMLGKRHE